MIRIFGAGIEDLKDAEALCSSLPKQWREAWEKAHPKARGESRVLSLGGLYLLSASGARGELVYGASGKPFLKDSGVRFSISHTHGAVFCAVSERDEEGEIGLDAEDMGRFSALHPEGLVRRWFSQGEQESLEKNNTREAFFGIWTRKEALVKHNGRGLAGLREADTIEAEDRLRFVELLHGEILLSLCCEKDAFVEREIRFL